MKRMPDFTAVVTNGGPLRTGAPHGFSLKIGGVDVRAEVRTLIQYEGEGWFYDGLRVLLRFQTDSIPEAVQVTETAAEGILQIMALATSADTPAFVIEQIIQHPEDDQPGKLIRFSQEHIPHLKLRKAYWNHLDPIFAALQTCDAKTRARIVRSLRWMKRALTEQDPLDRFAGLWIGLDALNPKLRDHWDIKVEWWICPHCGKKTGRKNTASGVAHLLQTIPEGSEAIAKEVAQLRHDTLHALKDVGETRDRVIKILPAVEAAIPRGICELLGLQDVADSLARPPLPPLRPYSAAVEVEVQSADGGMLASETSLPHLEFFLLPEYTFDEKGEPETARFSAEAKIFLPSGAEVTAASGWVVTREKTFVEMDRVNSSLFHGEGERPEKRGKGVTLWELSNEKVREVGKAPDS